MSNDQTKIGIYREAETYIALVDNVVTGGTPALNGSWEQLPVEETSEIKPNVNNIEKTDVAGDTVFLKSKRMGFNYTSHFLQRDADAVALEDTYANKDCILLMKGHNFDDLATPVQEWVLLFGTVMHQDSALSHEEGAPDFIFRTKKNPVAITVGSGGLALPSGVTGADVEIAVNAHLQREEV